MLHYLPLGFEQIEGLRGKEALVQAVVKNIARKEDKPPETRSDDELRVLLRSKGEQTMQVSLLSVALLYGFEAKAAHRTVSNMNERRNTNGISNRNLARNRTENRTETDPKTKPTS